MLLYFKVKKGKTWESCHATRKIVPFFVTFNEHFVLDELFSYVMYTYYVKVVDLTFYVFGYVVSIFYLVS